MKLSKKALLLVIAIAGLFLSSCTSYPDDAAGHGANFMGIMRSDPDYYRPAGPNAITLSTGEITERKNISGDEVSLLFGAIRFQDY